MSGFEKDFIEAALAEDWAVPLGPDVTALEEELKMFLGDSSKEVALVNSGTAAIHLALLCAGVKPGDEVLVQSFTFSASANPIVYLGATPVFIDSESQTWNMNPDLLEEATKERTAKSGRKPAAIVPVALYGMPYQADRILEIASKYDIPVVEDAAEALGSCYDGRKLGTLGTLGTLSFNGNKMITTSGGGAVVCPDAATKKKIIWYATQTRENYPWYHHKEIGYNYRLSNISACIGRGQMKVLDRYVERHHRIHELYASLLGESDGFKVQANPSPVYDSNFWLTTVLLPEGMDVEETRQAMDAAGVETRHLWKPLHMQPIFKDCPAYVDGTSEGLFARGLCLPSGPYVTDEDIRYITESLLHT